MKMLERAANLRNNLQLVDIEGMVPQNHLLRKIDQAVDFDRIYELVEHLYSADTGRPAVDPVVLIKMVFIQHLFGIKSLRQTVKEIDMNIAYRWFLGFDLSVKIPHFATISYAFSQRFPSEIFEEIFSWILEEAVTKGYVDANTIFIDATHVKANANRNVYHYLIQAGLFSESGISTKALEYYIKNSYTTIKKELDFIDSHHLLIKTRAGRDNYYMLNLEKLDHMLLKNHLGF